jgi:hypothetical protein
MAAPFLATGIMGGVQLLGGLIAAGNMGPRPRYTMSPEMQRSAGRAEYMAGMGFLPEERAAAVQEGRNQSAGMFRRSMDAAGGNLARSLFAAQGADNLGFQNRLASQDANLRRGNIRYADSFSKEAQRLRDANTQADLNFRMQEEKALGGAIQQGTENLTNMFNQNALMKFYDKLYGGGGVDAGLGMKNSIIPVNSSGTVGVLGGVGVGEGSAFANSISGSYPKFGGRFANYFRPFNVNLMPKFE